MSTRIRPGRAEDLAALERIARAAYVRYVPRIGRAPAPMLAHFAAAMAAGRTRVCTGGDAGAPVLGYAVAFPRADHWHVEYVTVDPATQGRGHGLAPIAHVEALATLSGARAVKLSTPTAA